MLRKTAIVWLVVLGLLTAACGAPATTVNQNTAVTPDVALNGNADNTNGAGLGNDNSANSNTSGLGNTNGSNTNSAGVDNTNSNNTNGAGLGNTNSANTNDSGLGNTNSSNTNSAAGNTNGSTTPAAPAGTGLTTQFDSYQAWSQALQAQGETVTQQGEVTSMGFDGLPAGQGRTVTVRGETVQVIEFSDAATARSVADALLSGEAQLEQLFPGMSRTANVWTSGRVIVIYFGNQGWLLNLLNQTTGAAVLGGGNAGGNAGGNSAGAGAPPALLDSVQDWLAGQLAIGGSQIQLVSVQHQVFNDGCLGLGNPGEFCNMAQTPGWVIVYSVNGQQYTAHVSQDGGAMRLQPATP